MLAVENENACIRDRVKLYARSPERKPLLLHGEAYESLLNMPAESIDFCMTSPPYWNQRDYLTAGIGLETAYPAYISALLRIIAQIKRVLKPTGSFWLNIGDTYSQKTLLGIPWRIAIRMTDEQGWILRNEVVWHKVKGGPDNAVDKLRNVHESVFHFVKSTRYYYDVDAIRNAPRLAKVAHGAVISATGVSGVRYKRQIEMSTALNEAEKRLALDALKSELLLVREGKLQDFRMIIRGQQRTTHSDEKTVSGRARDLEERGFYFLRYHPNGSKPKDVWDILPEDTQGRSGHFAAYPEELCRIPLLSTCPSDGIALDPFCGTGTTFLPLIVCSVNPSE